VLTHITQHCSITFNIHKHVFSQHNYISFYQNTICKFLFHSTRKFHKTKEGRARSEPGGTRLCTGWEVKGKLANGVGSQYSHAISERGLSSITQVDAHTSAASSRLNWRPHRFKRTCPFRGKTKSGFCAMCHHVPHELYWKQTKV